MEPAAEAELAQQYKQLYTEYRLAVTASYFADAPSLSGQGPHGLLAHCPPWFPAPRAVPREPCARPPLPRPPLPLPTRAGLFEWQGPHGVLAGEQSAPLTFLGVGTPDATSPPGGQPPRPPGASPAFAEASPVKQGLPFSLEQPSPASVALLESIAGFQLPEQDPERLLPEQPPKQEQPEPEQPPRQGPGLGPA